jgi:hypothetical protein
MPRGSHPGERRGGRQRGTPNRATAAKAAAVAASGLTPLDFLLSVLRDETAPRAERMEAAARAAPYVHPRLAAIEHSGPIEVEEPLDFLRADTRGEGSAAAAAGRDSGAEGSRESAGVAGWRRWSLHPQGATRARSCGGCRRTVADWVTSRTGHYPRRPERGCGRPQVGGRPKGGWVLRV